MYLAVLMNEMKGNKEAENSLCVCVCVFFLQTFGILKCALPKNAARAVNSQLKHFVSERLFSLFSLFGK